METIKITHWKKYVVEFLPILTKRRCVNQYIEFSTASGKLTVEAEVSSVVRTGGDATSKGKAAGLPSSVKQVVVQTGAFIEDAIKSAIGVNARLFYDAIAALPNPPSEAAIEFGLKVSGEVGNVIVSKAASEASYTVKLNWKGVTSKG
jgi:hypothetical protein